MEIMRGAFYTGSPLLEVRDSYLPKLEKGEILVKVDTAAICGTDVHIVAGEYFSRPPVILGHEFSGYVEELGAGVSEDLKGQLVTIEPHEYCHTCHYCRNGKEHLCLEKHAFGSYYNGGFAEYAIVPAYTAYKVPPEVSAEEAALCEVTGCCIHGVDRALVVSGDFAVVLGGSAVGLIFVRLLKMTGAGCIVVSEPNQQRRELAQKFGADYSVSPEQLKEMIEEKTNGLGADIVIESSGTTKAAEQGIEILGKGGRLVIFGVAVPGRIMQVEQNLLFQKELSIIGSNINPYTHGRALRLMPQLKLSELITHRYALQDVNEAINTAREGRGLKVVIKPHG